MHCERGDGPWDQCIIVPGFFGGSCANCHYGGEGTHCSFHAGKYILGVSGVKFYSVV